MKIEEFIKGLKKDTFLRNEFFSNPEEVAKKYNLLLTNEQLKKLRIAKELEKDPLLEACMCPTSSGCVTIEEDRKSRSYIAQKAI